MLDKEEGIKIFNIVQEIQEYQKQIAKYKEENKYLQEQLDYIRSGEYYNQLRFERDMLQDLVDKRGISKEDKEFIDCTHRNTELLEIIDKAIEYIEKGSYKDLYNIKAIDDLLEILKGDSNE